MSNGILNKSVPRYTSYPTAVQFTDKVTERDYIEGLYNLEYQEPISLYVHIPFCQQMCWYCACHTQITKRQDLICKYVRAIVQEIQLVAERAGPGIVVNHLHFGGGTPNALSPDQMQQLMRVIRGSFTLAKDAEMAIELDPRTLTDEMLDCLKDEGFNRISLGIQDFDPEVQEAIHRVQPYDDVAEVLQKMRDRGFDDISFDLIYGLPKQNTQKMQETLERVKTLSPSRVSVFGYAHVPWMKSHQKMIKKSPLPAMNERRDMCMQISDYLKEAGYQQIGIDHFAKADDDMAVAYRNKDLHRNFQGYTTDKAKNLIGIGASSIGRINNIYVQNTTDIAEYQRAVQDGRLPIHRGVALTEEDVRRASIIQDVMCYFAADVPQDILDDVKDALGFYIQEGIVSVDDAGHLEVLQGDQAAIYARLVAACFDQYLKDNNTRHAKAV